MSLFMFVTRLTSQLLMTLYLASAATWSMHHSARPSSRLLVEEKANPGTNGGKGGDGGSGGGVGGEGGDGMVQAALAKELWVCSHTDGQSQSCGWKLE